MTTPTDGSASPAFTRRSPGWTDSPASGSCGRFSGRDRSVRSSVRPRDGQASPVPHRLSRLGLEFRFQRLEAFPLEQDQTILVVAMPDHQDDIVVQVSFDQRLGQKCRDVTRRFHVHLVAEDLEAYTAVERNRIETFIEEYERKAETGSDMDIAT